MPAGQQQLPGPHQAHAGMSTKPNQAATQGTHNKNSLCGDMKLQYIYVYIYFIYLSIYLYIYLCTHSTYRQRYIICAVGGRHEAEGGLLLQARRPPPPLHRHDPHLKVSAQEGRQSQSHPTALHS